MKGWLFPYGTWYALAAVAAADAAEAGVRGDVLDAVPVGLIAAAVGVLALRSQVRWSRSGEKTLRAELIRLVDERAGSGAAAWLHRDAGLLFNSDRRRVAWMRERELLVIDEELLRDVNDARDAGGGKVAATYTSYRAHPVFPRVLRRVDGTVALVTAADVEEAYPGVRELRHRRWTGPVRALRSGRAFADAGELAEVVAQFRDAEPVSPNA
jgi:hypothetical protein